MRGIASIPKRLANAFVVFFGQYGDISREARETGQSRQSMCRDLLPEHASRKREQTRTLPISIPIRSESATGFLRRDPSHRFRPGVRIAISSPS